MKKQISAELLNKYLKGQCTPEEEAHIDQWYSSYQNNFDHISSISDSQKEVIKSRIQSRVNQNIDLKRQPADPARGKVRAIVFALSGVAASVLIVLAILLNHQTSNTANNSDVLIVTNNTSNIYEQILSDGSHVWLNPGAQIKFSKVFSGNKREISMTGESFFEITKNPAKPFVIYSGNLVTKVWGTSFRIRDSKNMPYADVTVVTGKVSVKLLHTGSLHTKNAISDGGNGEVMIYPTQKVTYNKVNEAFKESIKTDMKDLQIWKKINVEFDSRPMSDVLPVLDKEFDVNITANDDKINAYLLNADFNGLNLMQVLELVHKTLNVNYEMKGNNIILTSNQ